LQISGSYPIGCDSGSLDNLDIMENADYECVKVLFTNYFKSKFMKINEELRPLRYAYITKHKTTR
jgi:hypothetical protein